MQPFHLPLGVDLNQLPLNCHFPSVFNLSFHSFLRWKWTAVAKQLQKTYPLTLSKFHQKLHTSDIQEDVYSCNT